MQVNREGIRAKLRLEMITILPTRWLGAALAAVLFGSLSTACDTPHGANVMEVEGGDCRTCHLADHQKAIFPNHVSGNVPENCEGCHYETFWRPPFLLRLHKEREFPLINTDHEEFTCAECHDPNLPDVPSIAGENADCVNCHTGAHLPAEMEEVHEGVLDYPTGDQPPNFCLSCHPDGINRL